VSEVAFGLGWVIVPSPQSMDIPDTVVVLEIVKLSVTVVPVEAGFGLTLVMSTDGGLLTACTTRLPTMVGWKVQK